MRRALNSARAINEQMLMTIDAKIAQPRDSIVSPWVVNPSIVNVSGLSCWLIQATKRSSEPLITKEISPKVSMYRGKAITFMTGAIMELIRPKMAPITSKVIINCHNSSPPNGLSPIPGMIAEISQIPRPLIEVLTRKRFMCFIVPSLK